MTVEEREDGIYVSGVKLTHENAEKWKRAQKIKEKLTKEEPEPKKKSVRLQKYKHKIVEVIYQDMKDWGLTTKEIKYYAGRIYDYAHGVIKGELHHNNTNKK